MMSIQSIYSVGEGLIFPVRSICRSTTGWCLEQKAESRKQKAMLRETEALKQEAKLLLRASVRSALNVGGVREPGREQTRHRMDDELDEGSIRQTGVKDVARQTTATSGSVL